jgi:hypothetical protein
VQKSHRAPSTRVSIWGCQQQLKGERSGKLLEIAILLRQFVFKSASALCIFFSARQAQKIYKALSGVDGKETFSFLASDCCVE